MGKIFKGYSKSIFSNIDLEELKAPQHSINTKFLFTGKDTCDNDCDFFTEKITWWRKNVPIKLKIHWKFFFRTRIFLISCYYSISKYKRIIFNKKQ